MKDQAIQMIQALPDDATLSQMHAALLALEPKIEARADPPPLYTGQRKAISYTVTVVSGTLAVVTVILVVSGLWTEAEADKLSFFYVYTFWVFAPPLWFFLEYVWLFDPLRGDASRVQDFNTSQALSQKVWAALLAFLSVFALITWRVKF